MPAKEKVIHVRIPPDLHSAFKQAADHRGLPMSILVRELITTYCRDNAQLDLLATPKKGGRK